jgi:phosphatidylinositol alpha-1,6-mannosyltransferase
VLTVGRLQKRKGHDVMIKALPAIRESVPDILFAVIGDGEERENIERLVIEYGVADQVQLLGEVDDATMISCYQQCDLFALANRQVGRDIEGFGMVLVEAQSCGRPVLAGASGGTRETMRIGETGIVVPCEEPHRLADELRTLLSDRERLEAMGRAARPWVVENLDWNALTEQAAELFEIPHSPVASGWIVSPEATGEGGQHLQNTVASGFGSDEMSGVKSR